MRLKLSDNAFQPFGYTHYFQPYITSCQYNPSTPLGSKSSEPTCNCSIVTIHTTLLLLSTDLQYISLYSISAYNTCNPVTLQLPHSSHTSNQPSFRIQQTKREKKTLCTLLVAGYYMVNRHPNSKEIIPGFLRGAESS